MVIHSEEEWRAITRIKCVMLRHAHEFDQILKALEDFQREAKLIAEAIEKRQRGCRAPKALALRLN
jgi:DNA polymerase III epsilon subunit-like protein